MCQFPRALSASFLSSFHRFGGSVATVAHDSVSTEANGKCQSSVHKNNLKSEFFNLQYVILSFLILFFPWVIFSVLFSFTSFILISFFSPDNISWKHLQVLQMCASISLSINHCLVWITWTFHATNISPVPKSDFINYSTCNSK